MTQVVKTMKSALLAATMAISFGAVPAFAGSPITARTLDGEVIEVTIERAYFETDEGVAKVYAALQVEVKNACKDGSNRFTAKSMNLRKRCEARLLGELVKSANSRMLHKVHFEATAH